MYQCMAATRHPSCTRHSTRPAKATPGTSAAHKRASCKWKAVSHPAHSTKRKASQSILPQLNSTQLPLPCLIHAAKVRYEAVILAYTEFKDTIIPFLWMLFFFLSINTIIQKVLDLVVSNCIIFSCGVHSHGPIYIFRIRHKLIYIYMFERRKKTALLLTQSPLILVTIVWKVRVIHL